MIARLLAAVLALVAVAAPAVAAGSCDGLFLGGLRPGLTIGAEDCHGAYAVGYSPVIRSPLWSAERLTPAGIALAEAYPRACDIKPDRSAAEGATDADYLRSGYDKGHLSPAGDFGPPDTQQATCVLSNMVPQILEANRYVWGRIEAQTRDLAKAHGGAFVVSGPVFGAVPSYLRRRVPIPAGTYKVVVTPVGAWAYVASNSVPVRCRLTSVRRVEAERGTRLVPALDDGRRAGGWMPTPVKGCEREAVE